MVSLRKKVAFQGEIQKKTYFCSSKKFEPESSRMKNYYYFLSLPENASEEEIKKAYRKLSLKYHPDKNENDDFFAARFREAQEAYEILMDKELKLQDLPAEVKINPVKIASEKENVVMKNAQTVKLEEGGGAFHDKKDKNKKINLGGPTRRNPPKTKPTNRAQAKAKSKAKRKK